MDIMINYWLFRLELVPGERKSKKKKAKENSSLGVRMNKRGMNGSLV
jgi:hypothetical protein